MTSFFLAHGGRLIGLLRRKDNSRDDSKGPTLRVKSRCSFVAAKHEMSLSQHRTSNREVIPGLSLDEAQQIATLLPAQIIEILESASSRTPWYLSRLPGRL